MNWKTPYNSVPDKGQKVVGKSMTEPSQTMSIREMIDRHVRGLPIRGNIMQPSFDGGMDATDFKRLDLTERQELLEANRDRIKKIDKKLKDEEKKPKKELKKPQDEKPDEKQSELPLDEKSDPGQPRS